MRDDLATSADDPGPCRGHSPEGLLCPVAMVLGLLSNTAFRSHVFISRFIATGQERRMTNNSHLGATK